MASTEVAKARGEYIDTTSSKATVGALGLVWLPSQTHLKTTRFFDRQRQVPDLGASALPYGASVGRSYRTTVRDVDPLRGRLNVREDAVRVNGRIFIGTPKNHSARTVPFPDFLTLEIAQACEGKQSDGLLFGDGVTHLKQPAHRDGWFVAALRTAQSIDPTFAALSPHDLRHTAASLAISAGGNLKAIQRMLGHSSAAMTLDVYADLLDDDLDTLSAALNDARAISVVGKVWARDPNGPSKVTQIPWKQKEVGI